MNKRRTADFDDDGRPLTIAGKVIDLQRRLEVIENYYPSKECIEAMEKHVQHAQKISLEISQQNERFFKQRAATMTALSKEVEISREALKEYGEELPVKYRKEAERFKETSNELDRRLVESFERMGEIESAMSQFATKGHHLAMQGDVTSLKDRFSRIERQVVTLSKSVRELEGQLKKSYTTNDRTVDVRDPPSPQRSLATGRTLPVEVRQSRSRYVESYNQPRSKSVDIQSTYVKDQIDAAQERARARKFNRSLSAERGAFYPPRQRLFEHQNFFSTGQVSVLDSQYTGNESDESAVALPNYLPSI